MMTEDEKALARAVKIDDFEAVKDLLAAGLSANGTDTSGTPLLCNASQRGEVDIAAALLAAGANVNAADKDGATPLIIAALKGDVPMLSLLIKAGAALDHQNKFDDETAIAGAAGRGHLDAVKLLIEAGANIHTGEDEYTAPLDMARFGHHEKVEGLLQAALAAERQQFQEREQRSRSAERRLRLRQLKKPPGL